MSLYPKYFTHNESNVFVYCSMVVQIPVTKIMTAKRYTLGQLDLKNC